MEKGEPMSILIKGIDLPNSGQIEIIIRPHGKVFSKTRGISAEAIQIPTPHGRLIDIDKVKDKLRDQIPCCGLDMTYSNSNAFETMDNAPTILEAEP